MASKANNDGTTAKRGRKASKKNTTESEIVLGLTIDQQRAKVIEAAKSLRPFDTRAWTDADYLQEMSAVPVTFGGIRFHVKGFKGEIKDKKTGEVIGYETYALLVLGKGVSLGARKLSPILAKVDNADPMKLKLCAFMAWVEAGGRVTPEMGCEIAEPVGKGGRKSSKTSDPNDTADDVIILPS
jgi:hypothetical protein